MNVERLHRVFTGQVIEVSDGFGRLVELPIVDRGANRKVVRVLPGDRARRSFGVSAGRRGRRGAADQRQGRHEQRLEKPSVGGNKAKTWHAEIRNRFQFLPQLRANAKGAASVVRAARRYSTLTKTSPPLE